MPVRPELHEKILFMTIIWLINFRYKGAKRHSSTGDALELYRGNLQLQKRLQDLEYGFLIRNICLIWLFWANTVKQSKTSSNRPQEKHSTRIS